MMIQNSFRAFALTGVAGLALLYATPALAQGGRHTFNVPAGTLANAVAAFSAQSGINVEVAAPDAATARVNGITGSYADQEAFSRMLAGTGLSWHYSGATIVVDGMVAQAPAGEHVLSAVQVEGAESGMASLDGFGAGAGANGSSDVAATEGTRSLTTNGTSVATKTPTAIKNTPQTIAVITSEQIKQQNLTDVYSALQSTPGITLTNINGNGGLQNNVILSRGFTVDTFVVDGGAPFNYQIRGGQTVPDLSEYDRIEVLKGSDGLFGGASNPGGVVNLVRKRPLDHRQLTLDGRLGSWADGRAEIDVTGPIVEDLRARFVAAYQRKEFFYDFAKQNLFHLYGVLERDLGDSTIIRMGGSFHKEDSNGDNAFGLPRYYNGDDIGAPISRNYSFGWTYTHNRNDEEFVQIEHKFSEGWNFSGNVTRTAQNTKALQAYFQGPVRLNGTGFSYGGPRYSDMHMKQVTADGHLNGAFQLLGQTQKFLIGADYQDSKFFYYGPGRLSSLPFSALNPDFARYGANPGIPNPAAGTYDGQILTQNAFNHQWGLYANLMLEPIKGLHINGGLRYSNYYNSNYSYSPIYFTFLPGIPLSAPPVDTENKFTNVLTPTASIVYEISKTFSVYFSYSEIYKQNGALLTNDGTLLPPLSGVTMEGGIKAAFADGKLNASLTGFSVKEDNIAVFVGSGTTTTQGFCCYASNAGQTNTGIELQVSGEVAKGWQVNAGYTYIHQDYNAEYRELFTSGLPFSNSQQPEHQIKLWSAYTPVWEQRFTLLAGLRMDSDRYTAGSACLANTVAITCPVPLTPFQFTQSLYAIADIGLQFRPDERWTLGVNVTNITDKRYFATAGSIQNNNFYGEPRKVLFSLRGVY
ncbi:hypothetical protein C1T17_18400 [Sphingobium sp. SCG-1]|uniref:TonB-dependent siderophore receptor n=1 Tax=Sphingobium sp. SCG-1 TaxID=2072936 RepID=UPI000CD68B6B|nr:TonB-dependent siderophore receptor [Sphingobium sp. SCG-1]AUW59752.1 hypothetical protein C1T17_18400 [Sphingobium sp. SCG-1]